MARFALAQARSDCCRFESPIANTHRRNAYYPPHAHPNITTHLIRRGSLTIAYPDDDDRTKKVFGVGCRIDVNAGHVHEVWIGDEGCEYVIGE